LSHSKRVGWLGVDYFPEFFVQEISAYLCVPLDFKQNKFWATSKSVREAKMTQKIWIDLKKNEKNWQTGQIRWVREAEKHQSYFVPYLNQWTNEASQDGFQ